MKPIPALVLFIAGLVTGTALTWLAVAPPAARAPAGAPPSTLAFADARGERHDGYDEHDGHDEHDGLGGLGRLGDDRLEGDEGDDDGDDGDDGDPRNAREQRQSRASAVEGADDIHNAGVIEVARAEILDHDAWAKQGFVQMTPPVRLPSDGAARDKIEVWLRVPEGGRVEARRLPDGRATIQFPPGTIADRVESWGYAKADAPSSAGSGAEPSTWKYSVTDVRGTRIDANGKEMFHVFVPTGPEPLARLVGWEWQRGDRLQERAATSFLVSHLETLRTIQDRGQPQTAQERRALIDAYRRNNNCAKCHAHDKPVQVMRRRGIHRATDANGFYVPLSVLMDTVPLERHRVRDMNVGDPFLTITCPRGDDPVLAEGAAGARDYRCLGGGAPSATLDVRRALAANDPRTIAMCKSRAYLRERMDEAGRALFAEAFAACGL